MHKLSKKVLYKPNPTKQQRIKLVLLLQMCQFLYKQQRKNEEIIYLILGEVIV